MLRDDLILIVDNPNFVDRVVGLLNEDSDKYHFDIASDFEEARFLFDQEKHPLVLLDINLPGRSGIELLKLFKAGDQQTEVIMLTNHIDPYYKTTCLALGAAHFLDKTKDIFLLPGLLQKGKVKE